MLVSSGATVNAISQQELPPVPGVLLAPNGNPEAQRTSGGILTGPIHELCMAPQRGIQVRRGAHPPEQFDILYPCLGARFRSDLAASVGAERLDSGALVVDERRQTSVPGLYAIGDVVEGLKQLSVAIGQAAQAATAIHNELEPNPWRADRRRAGG